MEKNLEEQKKSAAGKAGRTGAKQLNKDDDKNFLEEEHNSEKDKASHIASSGVPLVTISSLPLPNDHEVPMNEYSLARMVAESHPKQNHLFENVLNQHHSRPTSSIHSKSSLTSSKVK